jgi:hypothetical protein
MLQIQSSYPYFTDKTGSPLNAGSIYIGVAGQNAQSNPTQVYYDEAGTLPAAQPLKTTNGYIYRSGVPTRLYTALTDYSMVVRDKNAALVFNTLSSSSVFNNQLLATSSGAAGVGYTQGGISAVTRTVQDKLRDAVSVKDFGAVGDGVTDDINAFVAAYNTGKGVFVPDGSYIVNVATQDQANAIMGMMISLHLFCSSLVVNIGAGVFNFSTRTTFDVTNGYKLKVIGAAHSTLTFSALLSIVSIGSNNHQVTIRLVNATTVDIGDFLIVETTFGTNAQEVLEGVWEVIGKASNDVTLKNKADVVSFSAVPTLTAASIKKINTVMKYTNSLGFLVRTPMGADSGLGSGFSRMAVVGDDSSNVGVLIEYGCSASFSNEFALCNFGSHGIYPIYHGVVILQDSFVCGIGENGVYSLNGSTIQGVRTIVNGNGAAGFVASTGARIAASQSKACGNNSGYRSLGGSVIICNSSVASYNTNYGHDARESGYLDATGATSKADRNGLYGISASGNCYVDFTSGNAASNGTLDAIEADIESVIKGGTYGTSSLNTRPIRMLTGTAVHDFGVVNANTTKLVAITVAGAANNANNTVSVGYNGAEVLNTAGSPIPCLVVTGRVTGVDTVTLYASNVTTSNSNAVGNRTYRVQVNQF